MVRSVPLFAVTGESRHPQQDVASWLLFPSTLQVRLPPERRGSGPLPSQRAAEQLYVYALAAVTF